MVMSRLARSPDLKNVRLTGVEKLEYEQRVRAGMESARCDGYQSEKTFLHLVS